jgi:glycerol kinase
VVEAMEKDSGIRLDVLRVDGGMVGNDLLMQFQADILDRPVVRPVIRETTALGAAYAAGLATGFFRDLEDLRANWQQDLSWSPRLEAAERDRLYAMWKKAVTRSFDWVEPGVTSKHLDSFVSGLYDGVITEKGGGPV